MSIAKGTSAREHFEDPRIDRLQNEVRNLRALIANVPFLDGALIKDEPLTTSPLQIRHRLGRVPKGFIVMSASPDAAVGLSATQPSDQTISVNIEASATTTATLWFW